MRQRHGIAGLPAYQNGGPLGEEEDDIPRLRRLQSAVGRWADRMGGEFREDPVDAIRDLISGATYGTGAGIFNVAEGLSRIPSPMNRLTGHHVRPILEWLEEEARSRIPETSWGRAGGFGGTTIPEFSLAGDVADVARVPGYWKEGQFGLAGLSALGAIPFIGTPLAKIMRGIRRAKKARKIDDLEPPHDLDVYHSTNVPFEGDVGRSGEKIYTSTSPLHSSQYAFGRRGIRSRLRDEDLIGARTYPLRVQSKKILDPYSPEYAKLEKQAEEHFRNLGTPTRDVAQMGGRGEVLKGYSDLTPGYRQHIEMLAEKAGYTGVYGPRSAGGREVKLFGPESYRYRFSDRATGGIIRLPSYQQGGMFQRVRENGVRSIA